MKEEKRWEELDERAKEWIKDSSGQQLISVLGLSLFGVGIFAVGPLSAN